MSTALWNPAKDCIAGRPAKDHVLSFVRDLEIARNELGGRLDESEVEVLNRRYISRVTNFSDADQKAVIATIHILSDLAKLGWKLSVEKGGDRYSGSPRVATRAVCRAS